MNIHIQYGPFYKHVAGPHILGETPPNSNYGFRVVVQKMGAADRDQGGQR